MMYRLIDKKTGLFVVLSSTGQVRYTSQWGEARVLTETEARLLSRVHENLALVECPRPVGVIAGPPSGDSLGRKIEEARADLLREAAPKVQVLAHAATAEEVLGLLKELDSIDKFLDSIARHDDCAGAVTTPDGRFRLALADPLSKSVTTAVRQRAEVIRSTLRAVCRIDA